MRLRVVALNLRLWTVVVVCVSLAQNGSGRPTNDSYIWLLGEDSNFHDSYAFFYSACDTARVVAVTKDRLHADYFSTHQKIWMTRFNFPMPVLFIQNRLINEEQDEVIVAVHEGYMTISKFASSDFTTTFSIPVKKPSSLFLTENLACVTPTTSSRIFCVNLIKGTQALCNDNIPPGSHGYANFANSYLKPVCLMTPDRKKLMIFEVMNDCVSFVRTISGHNYGNNMWFSNNGTIFFFSSGLTNGGRSLKPSEPLCHQPVGKYTYTSVSQVYSNAELKHRVKDVYRPIISLRKDATDQVFFITWPDFACNGTKTIPSPFGYSIVQAISVQYCSLDFAYALVIYKRIKDGAQRAGVAYLKSFY